MSLDKFAKLAVKAMKSSHSPYSQKKIGSCVVTDTGEYFLGANIENASYGATVCAERVAIWKALTESPESKIKTIYVCSDETDPWPPCGMCRQVIAEFATKNCEIFCINPKGKQIKLMFRDLFPSGFGPNHLKSS
jgi:cytidine deaminase